MNNEGNQDSHELESIGRWLPEANEVIDDVISELSSKCFTNKDMRENLIKTHLYPEGENFESDIGYIQCKPPRYLLVDLIHGMLDVEAIFHGIIYRDKAVLCTVLIGFGLVKIESLLAKNPNWEEDKWKAFCEKQKRWNIENYSFQHLPPVEKGKPFYEFNYPLLDSTISGRINRIKRLYYFSRGLQAELCIVEALRTSRLLPEWVINDLNKEHDEFENWINKRDKLDKS